MNPAKFRHLCEECGGWKTVLHHRYVCLNPLCWGDDDLPSPETEDKFTALQGVVELITQACDPPEADSEDEVERRDEAKEG